MKKIIFVLLLNAILFSACEDVVDVDIKSFESALIVEGGIYHQIDGSSDLQNIQLSQTVNFLDQNGPTPITNAQIEIFDGSDTYTFSHIEKGNYSANIPTTVGKTYQITIRYNDQIIIGEETLVNTTPIDSIYTEFEEETIFTDAGYFVKINTSDEPDIANFYHWRVFINDTLSIIPDPGNQANLIVSDEFFGGQSILGYKPNEEIILEIGEIVRVEQLGISERYFEYLYQVFGQTVSIPIIGNPPPALIRGNLFNTTDETQFVLGYFTVAALSKAETIVTE